MHSLYEKANALSYKVIGAAIEVHKTMGSGLYEAIYEKCLMRELELQGIQAKNQRIVPVAYKGFEFEEPLRLDVIAEDCLILELKSVETVMPAHKAKLLAYMKLLDIPLGLVINFHEPILKNGISRMILPGADK
ncbi:GxxExxY protein [Pontiellaceae bacterium B12227]|nr:GxxExxY protein [Pontiellaceae bacterium B12227]